MSDISSTLVDASQIRWARLRELKSKHILSDLFLALYRYKIIRKYVTRLILKYEGGKFFSQTLRMALKKYYLIEVGEYSYGSCLTNGVLPPATKVGNYCSFAENLRVYRRNHSLETLSQHPFFYNQNAGLLNSDAIEAIEDNPLIIGHDVWIGGSVIILPGCTTIGNGAVIGAGSVVTKSVPPYAIMGGNPAKLIRYRYSPELIEQIERTQWWDLTLYDLLTLTDLPFKPVNTDTLKLLQQKNAKETNNEQANIHNY